MPTRTPRGRFDLNWDRTHADRFAEEAEYGLYENKLHGVILQLRRRARAARRWGLVLLFLLVAIILFALMPYVLSPVLRDFLDGQKAVLEDSRDAAESALADLDARRDALKAELVEGLKQTPVTLRGDWPENTVFHVVHAINAGALLIVGNRGTLLRYDVATGTTERLSGDWPENTTFLAVHAIDAETLLIAGSPGTLVRYDVATGTTESLTGDWPENTFFQDVHAIDAETLLILGNRGTLLRYDVTTGTTERLTGDWPENTWFDAVHEVDAETLLILGSEGTLLRVSNELSDQIARAEIADDADLVRAMNALPPHIQRYPIYIDVKSRFDSIRGERDVVQPAFDDAQKNLDDLPTGVFQLNKQRKNFRDFMADCRDGSLATYKDDNRDSVTLACTQAWQATLDRDRQTWWQIIASQAPPGILLLFLLATLGGLYRYNMRLAGFHHSRADMLELSLDADGTFDEKRFASMAEAMAADKVDFARATSPAAQAVDLAKSVLQRTG